MDARDLPPGPERSWIPALAQSLSADFCEQRGQELNTYLQRLLARNTMPAPVQKLLGLRCPEPPGSLRVVEKTGVLELEVKPPEMLTFQEERQTGWASSAPMQRGGPVDGYYIEVLNLDSGSKHRLTRDVGPSGQLPQKAQVGHLDSGRHVFAVAAYNCAGCSAQVSITVDPSLALSARSSPQTAALPLLPQLPYGMIPAAQGKARSYPCANANRQVSQRMPEQAPGPPAARSLPLGVSPVPHGSRPCPKGPSMHPAIQAGAPEQMESVRPGSKLLPAGVFFAMAGYGVYL